ncbi:MAG: hypothetical protein ACE5FT_05645 [Candidatus Nanoarchaeia archaeon]
MSFWSDFKKGFHMFGENIGHIVNSILLLIAYIVAVGPTSILAKIKGKKFLEHKGTDSYWCDLDLKKQPKEEYYRQF